MPEGKIKKIVSEKGFGFIEGAAGGDIFFHHSALVDVSIESLQEGDAVKYDVGQGPKGPRAENVVRL
jgi:CspA family cold shock protein